MQSIQSWEYDGPPSLLSCHISLIDNVVVRARSPFTVGGVLHGSDGEKAEAPSTPHIILVMGSKMPLHFLFISASGEVSNHLPCPFDLQ
jgi:hypothetical protein